MTNSSASIAKLVLVCRSLDADLSKPSAVKPESHVGTAGEWEPGTLLESEEHSWSGLESVDENAPVGGKCSGPEEGDLVLA